MKLAFNRSLALREAALMNVFLILPENVFADASHLVMLHYLGHNSAKQIPQVNFSPQRGSQQGEEPGKRMAPSAHHAKKTH